MSIPQPVLSPLTPAAVFVVLTMGRGGEETVRALLADSSGLVRSVGFRAPDDGLSCVIGIGSEAWDRLFGEPRPAELHPFRELAGPRHSAVLTPGDLLLHIRANRMDLCFELAARLVRRLSRAASVVDEVHGFRYFDERDLVGFVDGTENPVGEPARRAVTIGSGDPDFAGGSYVIVQKYLHDLPAWESLSVEDQERAIGRTKLEDLELTDDHRLANSHVAVNTIIDDNGEQRQILRDNMPFGHIGAGEFGTYFIGYSATPTVTEQMLQNMFIGHPPGTTDRVLDFSTAVTGSLFFVPTADFLDDPPAGPGSALSRPSQPDNAKPDSSLRVGNLEGRAQS